MSFAVGQRVRAKSNAGMVGEVLAVIERRPGEHAYRVRFANGTRVVSGDSVVAEQIAADPREQLVNRSWAGGPELRLLLTGLRLREQSLTDQLRSLRAARLEHHPYQYKPLLKFLESEHQRVLIADEVGLGKTIEAGIVLSELSARQELARVLVVVPSNLRLKWQAELRERFDEEFEIRDTAWVRNVLLAPTGDRDPPPFKAITSIEALRRMANQVEQVRPPIDLLIIDEAHRLRNEDTLSFRVGRALSDGADGMLMCSATPMQTKDKDLYNLLRILLGDKYGSYGDFLRDLEANRPLVRSGTLIAKGAPPAEVAAALQLAARSLPLERDHDRRILKAEAAAIEKASELDPARRAELLGTVNRLNLFGSIITRTRKRDVIPNRPERVAHVVNVTFTDEEMEVYQAITEAAGEAVRRYGAWGGAALAMISRARQAASCLAVFLEKLGVAGGIDEDGQAALDVELTTMPDDRRDTVQDDTSAPVDLLERVKKEVSRVRLPVDTKLREFLRFIDTLRREPNYKVVVFSTFRGTVHYLSRKLQERGINHRVMTGEILDPEERYGVIRTFREDPTCHALLATEVGGEGIDLQFCHTLVNYDLPWNPMVVEQRIGRLDRLGQRSPEIRIAALNVIGTIESRIFERLYDRIELFKTSIGPLEVILGERTQKLALELLVLTPEAQAQKLQEARLAIESARKESESLDAEAVNLVGDDAYYAQRLVEIERAQGNIAADLTQFVRAWLTTHFKHAAIVEGSEPGALKLTRDTQLVQWLQERKGARDLAPFSRRYTAAGDAGLDLTFDQALAERRHRMEFITSRHPFVRAIGSALAETDAATPVAVCGVRTRCRTVAPRDYLLAVGLQDVSGIRPRRELFATATLLNDDTVLPDAAAAELLSSVVTSGTTFAHFDAGPEDLAAAADRCELALVERASALADVVRAENAIFVERRIASLQRWYLRRIEQADALSLHENERVRKMNIGRREALRARLEAQVAAANAKAQVNYQIDTKAFVVTRVDPS